MIVCSKCGKVFNSPVQPCPYCGGVVIIIKKFGTVVKQW